MACAPETILDVISTKCPTVLKLSDATSYTVGATVTNVTLTVLTPDSELAVVFSEQDPNFIKVLNSIDLTLSTLENENLPDGVYKFTLTSTVNLEEWTTEVYHLRTVLLYRKYLAEICKLQLETCRPSLDTEKRLKDLRYIKSYIDGAVAKVEFCNAVEQGSAMYKYADELLSKYKSGNCLTCK